MTQRERQPDRFLIRYWITFPNAAFETPLGIGVTAYSVEDALQLLEKAGFQYASRGEETNIREDVLVHELPEYVRQNMGPMNFRGIWYPCLNIGFGASGTK